MHIMYRISNVNCTQCVWPFTTQSNLRKYSTFITLARMDGGYSTSGGSRGGAMGTEAPPPRKFETLIFVKIMLYT